MPLHSPQNPRHARVFEILRQNELAADVTHYVRHAHLVPSEVDRIDAFRRNALRSLERSNDVLVGAETGRNHKLF